MSDQRSIVVKPVESGLDLKHFIDFPYTLYKENPYWVPQLRYQQKALLNPKKNPFFEHGKIQAFLATNESGEVLGRIAAIVNGMHLKKYADGNGFFGFFESIEDYDVTKALCDRASDWLKDQGLSGVRGPANPSMNDVSGLLVEGFDREPSVFMPYNPAYYQNYLSRYGFQTAMSMWAYFVHIKMIKLDRIRAGVEKVKKTYPGLKVRNASWSKVKSELRTIVDIHNDAFKDNWGHVPLTDSEFEHLAKMFKQFLDPDLVLFLELDNEAIGFTVCLPNLNEVLRHIRDGRLFPFGFLQYFLRSHFGGIRSFRSTLTGIKRKYHGSGFDAVLGLSGLEAQIHNKSFESCEFSWVLDINSVAKNIIESIGAIKDKRYVMLEKAL
ncbi:MAG: hypothetical protein R3A13_05445 [Bdellovibrionota bacterium]